MGNSTHYENMAYKSLMEGVTLLSQYRGVGEHQGKESEVVSRVAEDSSTIYGIRFRHEGKYLGYEWYPTKSQSWAEDAAENYVLGVKIVID